MHAQSIKEQEKKMKKKAFSFIENPDEPHASFYN